MKENIEGSICACCLNEVGNISINDDEHKEYWICEICDSDLFYLDETFYEIIGSEKNA